MISHRKRSKRTSFDRTFSAIVLGAFALSASVSVFGLYRNLLRQDCGLQPAQARAMVVEDLLERGLPLRALQDADDSVPCRYIFRYSGEGPPVDYAVRHDWRRGAVLARLEPAARP